MYIEVKQLNKKFGNYEASKNITFSIEKGKLVGLLGPSGGGKTTILRMLAGLGTPDQGDIYINGKRMNDVAPQDRGIGFVFQSYALFKSMTVFENIAFGLKIKKRSKQQIKERVTELMELTGLAGLENRLPYQLSGGQRQRVAFARALAPEPELLLLDEPFAAIDAKIRKELRAWLKEMIQRLGITTIFVTHDQEEAVEVADEIMIVNQGRLEQIGSPIHIYQQPVTAFVAGFIGESVQLSQPNQLKGYESFDFEGGQVIVRPEFVEIGTHKEISLPHASVKGKVTHVFFKGTFWQVHFEIGDLKLFAYRSLEKSAVKPGDEIFAIIHQIYVFDQDDSCMIENPLKRDPLPVFI